MKEKGFNLLLLATSLLVYLEWAGNNSAFLWEAERDVLFQLVTAPSNAIHPLTLIPLFGQLLLLGTLVQKQPSKTMGLIGLFCLSILVVFIFLIGLFALNWTTVLSCLPFLSGGTFYLMYLKRQKSTEP